MYAGLVWSRIQFNLAVSLLISCLDDLSIAESERLISPTMEWSVSLLLGQLIFTLCICVVCFGNTYI